MKIFKTICIILAMLIVVAVAFVAILTSLPSKEEFVSSFDKALIVLTETYPSDVMIYGENIVFSADTHMLQPRIITEITANEIKKPVDKVYSFLVINDRDGSAKFSKADWITIKKLVDENEISFYYLGEQYLDILAELGFYGKVGMDGNLSVGYFIAPPPFNRSSAIGIWTKDEEALMSVRIEILGEILAASFVSDVIKEMN
jgi:hypothetical protein